MAEKMTCPGCDLHTSSVLRAFRSGDDCPECGYDLTKVPLTTDMVTAQFAGERDVPIEVNRIDREASQPVTLDGADVEIEVGDTIIVRGFNGCELVGVVSDKTPPGKDNPFGPTTLVLDTIEGADRG